MTNTDSRTPDPRFGSIWVEQCEAAAQIRGRYGVADAFNYLVAEKLLNYADAAVNHAEFARQLPWFLSRVREIFTLDEINTHIERLEREHSEQEAAAMDDLYLEEDSDLWIAENPIQATRRAQQFTLVKELLTVRALGTS